jgi:uracil-DNA glycosylase
LDQRNSNRIRLRDDTRTRVALGRIGARGSGSMGTVVELSEAIRKEAERAEFPVDVAVYERAGKSPSEPILFAGSLEAPVCVFGRDLGKDEVAHGQPLIGTGGRLVRVGVCEAAFGKTPPKSDKTLESVLERVLLTNTVPYKPPGNKAYPESVKERFRPFVAELLAVHWKGEHLITLGTEAFQWFARYAKPGAAEGLWGREDRYDSTLACDLEVEAGDRVVRKAIQVFPLPHPSPLNTRWYGQFPALLASRLEPLFR